MRPPRTIVALGLLACLAMPATAAAEPSGSPTSAAPTGSASSGAPTGSTSSGTQTGAPSSGAPTPVQPTRTAYAPTSPTTSLPLPANVQEEWDSTEAKIKAATITPQMADAATFPVNPDDATFPLNADTATIDMETKKTDDKGSTTKSLASDILFDFGSAELTPAAVAKIPDLLKDIPQGIQVAVNGYTDSIGTDADNLVLSQKRAQAVADVIAQARPDLALTVTGFGEANPVADNTNPDGTDNPIGRSQNRRVELVYKG